MSIWTRGSLAVANDEQLLDWDLGSGHPSDPIRATLVVQALQQMHVPLVVEPITWEMTTELDLVHTRRYIHETLVNGRNSQWQGQRLDLGTAAVHMFAGTVQLSHALVSGRVEVGFSPQGAKHHAMADAGAGFCVFNDMAWAALHFAGLGKRVLYVDLDAHHGDGVETLTRQHPRVMTCSVHDSTIFPGTGTEHTETDLIFNYPLPHGAGDQDLRRCVEAIAQRAQQWRPHIVLIAVGADGHLSDPLSSLMYTHDGYAVAARLLGTTAAELQAPVLMGGAGGYRPKTHTPQIWATFVAGLNTAYRTRQQELAPAPLPTGTTS